jgi:geranylgeranyl reductase
MQYNIPVNTFEDMEIFFDSRLFKAWYLWIFPHENYVSIGCSCNPRYLSIGELKQNFLSWLKKNNIDTAKGQFLLHPLNYDYRGYRFNNIFLVGDAAGLASGLTGEGIYQALVSGEEVAKVILDKNYIPQELLRVGNKLQYHHISKEMLEQFGPFRPAVFELLLQLLKIIPYRGPFRRF